MSTENPPSKRALSEEARRLLREVERETALRRATRVPDRSPGAPGPGGVETRPADAGFEPEEGASAPGWSGPAAAARFLELLDDVRKRAERTRGYIDELSATLDAVERSLPGVSVTASATPHAPGATSLPEAAAEPYLTLTAEPDLELPPEPPSPPAPVGGPPPPLDASARPVAPASSPAVAPPGRGAGPVAAGAAVGPSRGGRPGPPPGGEPEPPAETRAPRPTDGARLVAIEMAMAGSTRGLVEELLRREYGVRDPGPILDDVFGKGSKGSSRLPWGQA